MHRACFVIRDLEKEVRNDLLDSCEVGVQQLPGDRTTFIDGMIKFCHNLLGCNVRNALNLLALHNEMQRYHLKVEGIPECINMLEDAQRQAGRAGRTIADETLLLFASTAMLTSERFRAQMMIDKSAQSETRHAPSGNPPTSGPMPRQESRHKPTIAV